MAYSKDNGGRNAYVETNRRYANKPLSMCFLHSAVKVVSVDSKKQLLLCDLRSNGCLLMICVKLRLWPRSVQRKASHLNNYQT